MYARPRARRTNEPRTARFFNSHIGARLDGRLLVGGALVEHGVELRLCQPLARRLPPVDGPSLPRLEPTLELHGGECEPVARRAVVRLRRADAGALEGRRRRPREHLGGCWLLLQPLSVSHEEGAGRARLVRGRGRGRGRGRVRVRGRGRGRGRIRVGVGVRVGVRLRLRPRLGLPPLGRPAHSGAASKGTHSDR